MGISNTSELLLSEECSILSRPLIDFQQGSQHHHRKTISKEKDLDKFEENLLSLEIKVLGVEVEEDNDGCTTPTSSEQRISSFVCPPPPRKAKSKKRKLMSCRRSLLDFSREVESMFPEALLADLGKKIKKVRSTN